MTMKVVVENGTRQWRPKNNENKSLGFKTRALIPYGNLYSKMFDLFTRIASYLYTKALLNYPTTADVRILAVNATPAQP